MDKVGAKVVVIGGGTGSFTLLRSLKNYTSHLTALVNMADDGGSTGQLRDELGVLPPGDVRQCLVALSESPRTRELFNYRFEKGTFAGHAFGNIFMAALETMTGNFAEAVEEASSVLNIVGHVEPVTLDPVTLVMQNQDGSITRGQFIINQTDFGTTRPTIRLEPTPRVNPRAVEAIEQADLIVIAPGNLYGSLAPTLVVPGIDHALRKSDAKKVYVCNLVTKPGQTDGFMVSDFAEEVERFMDGPKLDYVLYNNVRPPEKLVARYAHEGEKLVEFDTAALKVAHYRVKSGSFISGEFAAPNSGSADPIASSRTYIRHDGDKVARALMKIYFS